jgi:hypothetical protein
LRIDADRGCVHIAKLGDLTGANAQIIIDMAKGHLKALSQGLPPEDHPLLTARQLADLWSIGEPGVRRRFNRLRETLVELAVSHGMAPPDEDAVVENIPWHGYRLNPDRVLVAMDPGAPRKSGLNPSR